MALLVEGNTVRHKLRDEDTNIEVWYTGKLCSVSANTISIEYDGYVDALEWPRDEVIEDIRNKDLISQ